MRYYFAGAEPTHFLSLLKEKGVNRILVSYYHLPKSNIERYQEFDTFLDSGAFSALSQNDPIDIETYIGFLNENKDKFKLYANLDAIGSAENTLLNQNIIEAAGLNPLPCFHYGEDFSFLKHYADKYDYFAIGGLVPYAKDWDKLSSFLDEIFAFLEPYFKKDKPLKLHAFGMGGPKVLCRYPFYSADSTSWIAGGTFGRMVTWDSQKYKFIDQFHYSDKEKMLNNNINIKAIDEYASRLSYNIEQYLLMEEGISKLWEKRGIKWED